MVSLSLEISSHFSPLQQSLSLRYHLNSLPYNNRFPWRYHLNSLPTRTVSLSWNILLISLPHVSLLSLFSFCWNILSIFPTRESKNNLEHNFQRTLPLPRGRYNTKTSCNIIQKHEAKSNNWTIATPHLTREGEGNEPKGFYSFLTCNLLDHPSTKNQITIHRQKLKK